MSDVIIRTATYDDAGAIAALHVASWRDSFRGMIPDHVLDGPMLDERLPMWRQVLAIEPVGRFVLVATTRDVHGEEQILGFASGGRIRKRGGARFAAEVYTLYVAQEWRGQRLGCRLLASMAMRSKLFGHGSLMLWTLEANAPARAFYEALGGQPLGRRDDSFGGVRLSEIGYGWPRIETLLRACHDRLSIAT
ncbi:MAG: GNAT family N-acetyltransferase [Alphaproteobacteria bacterium]|nr:GNAT family N-acetyltransferase [Alphaproteobacteria bacterium]